MLPGLVIPIAESLLAAGHSLKISCTASTWALPNTAEVTKAGISGLLLPNDDL